MALLTSFWIVDGAIFFLTIFISAYLYATRNFQYWKKRGVVEIPPVPFFGNFIKYFKLQESPGYLLKHFYEQSDGLPYVGIYILDKPCLLLRDPEIIKRVLVRDFNYFSDKFMQSSKHDVISNNCVFFISNPYWKYIRQKFTILFTTGRLKNVFENVKHIGNDLDYYMDSLQLEGPGKTLNAKDIAGKFTTDLIGLAAYGLKLNSLRDPNAEFRKFGELMFGSYSFKRAVELTSILLAPHITTFFNFRFFGKKSCDFFRKAFHDILIERKDEKIQRNDLIDLLIEIQDNEDSNEESHGFKFDEDNLMAQAMIFFAAGFETSSTNLSFTLYELAKNPEIQTRLRTEINESIQENNGKITYEMVTELEYLDMVVAESLRMHPTLSFLDRKATRDYKIEETGLVIEKGTPILIPILGLQYDSKYYSSPEVFDPENFSNFSKSSRNSSVYLPFGIGPRSCIGMRQGLMQTKLGLVHIISRFKVTLANDAPLKMDSILPFNSVKGGLFLHFQRIGKTNIKN